MTPDDFNHLLQVINGAVVAILFALGYLAGTAP